jgi:hypothetical protein
LKKMWSGESWRDGYFAWTVGDRMNSEVVGKSIEYHRNIMQGPAQLEVKLR